MARDTYRWAWLALAIVALLGWGYGTRLTYRECRPSGCVVANRWTGSIRWVSASRSTTQTAAASDPVAEYQRRYQGKP